MSVQKAGPAGYTYQHLATVYLGLIHLQDLGPNFQLLSEPKGGEDMLLVFHPQAIPIKHHIQVKDRSGTINLEFLAECLKHYGDNQGDVSFLKRVIDGEIVWIFTSGKLADELHPLETRDWSGRTTKLYFDKAFRTSLLAELKKAHHVTNSDLQIARKASWEATVDQLDVPITKFNPALDSLNISPKLTSEDLEEKISFILNRHFQVIHAKCHIVLLELLDLTQKKLDQDLIPNFWEVLQRNREIGPKVNSNYVSPPDENRLLAKVRNYHLLMLRGESWSGKTQLARNLARIHYLEGFRFLETNSVREADRFLREPSADNRVCILEDPFGHYLHSNSWDIYLAVKELISAVQPGRVLLVTCRNEVLSELLSGSLSTSSSLPWEEVGAPSFDFFTQLIRQYLKLENWTDEELTELRGKLLEGNEVSLQAGQLAHLINELDENGLKIANHEQLLHIARFDEHSRSIFDNRPPAFGTLMKILCLNCNTLQSLPISTIPWFVCDAPERFLTEDRQEWPTFSELPSLPSALRGEIDFLEKRGYIEIQEGEIRFKHPNYLEVARQSIKAPETSSIQETLSIWDRSLIAPLPENARLATRSIGLFYYDDNTPEKLKKELLALSWKGRDSRYPGVEEEAILILAENWTELSGENAKSYFESVSDRFTNYEWINGFPIKPKEGPDRWFRTLSLSEVYIAEVELDADAVLQKFSSADRILTPQEFLVLVDRWKQNLEKVVNKDQLDRILAQPYYFIRRVASFLAVRHFKVYGKGVVLQIFREQDPRVLLEGIKGAFRVWPELVNEDQDWLYELLAKAYQRKPILAAVTNLMTQFSAGYGGHSFDWWLLALDEETEKRMWELWAKLMMVFFQEHPANVSFHTPRFRANMDTSKKFLDEETIQRLFLGWLGWADRLLVNSLWSRFSGNACTFYLSLKDRTEEFRRAVMHAILPNSTLLSSIMTNLCALKYLRVSRL